MNTSAQTPIDAPAALADLGITVLERGWLSSNSVFMIGEADSLVVDTGYVTHAEQTVALLKCLLGERPLSRIANTHLHSDHCGGNAALKHAWPQALIAIPPGHADAVRDWDTVALTYAPTGQQCPRFHFDQCLQPGEQLKVGALSWDIHAAPGHDPQAVLLHEPRAGVLISGDALWANGFGVVFPELEGEQAFEEVGETLTLIESLKPRTVIPGHGPVFAGNEVELALGRARSRLSQFTQHPAKHRIHALKVLLKFKLLEWQQVEHSVLLSWFSASDYFARIARIDHAGQSSQEIFDGLLRDLASVNALRLEGPLIVNQ
jgi:glyoxylase-like metal-dependent hydrolase (beta-lactamase superfamily II)